MAVTFRMSYGRAVPYICAAAIVMIIAIAVPLLMARAWWLGSTIILLAAAMAVFIYRYFHNPPVYVIDDNTITFKQLWRSEVYPIDRIIRIQYFDLGVEYSYGPLNARRQLGLYFDRKLFKSSEPRAFCPDDRDGFVGALLARNPAIKVDRNDIRPK